MGNSFFKKKKKMTYKKNYFKPFECFFEIFLSLKCNTILLSTNEYCIFMRAKFKLFSNFKIDFDRCNKKIHNKIYSKKTSKKIKLCFKAPKDDELLGLTLIKLIINKSYKDCNNKPKKNKIINNSLFSILLINTLRYSSKNWNNNQTVFENIRFSRLARKLKYTENCKSDLTINNRIKKSFVHNLIIEKTILFFGYTNIFLKTKVIIEIQIQQYSENNYSIHFEFIVVIDDINEHTILA